MCPRINYAIRVSSCSIEKRVHRSGYHVAWKNNQLNHQKQLLATDHESKNERHDIEKISKLKPKELAYKASKKELISVKEIDIPVAINEVKSEAINSLITSNSSNVQEAVVNEVLEKPFSDQVQESHQNKNTNGTLGGVMFLLLVLLCLIIPPLAVFLITDDLKTTLISLLLTILFWLPGVIFAFYILFTRY